MYDYVLSVTTTWPTLSCDYYPTEATIQEDYLSEHIISSLFTQGAEPEAI